MGDVIIWASVLALAGLTVWRITESPSQPTYPEDTTMATIHHPAIISSKVDPKGPTHVTIDWHGVPVVEGDTALISVELLQRCVDIVNAHNREHRQ